MNCTSCYISILVLLSCLSLVPAFTGDHPPCNICGCDGCPDDFAFDPANTNMPLPPLTPDQQALIPEAFQGIPLTCGLVNIAATGGLVPPDFCSMRNDPAFRDVCLCPALPDTVTETAVTASPVDPSTNAPVNPPTNPPVNPPTNAPVDPPTSAPVDPPTNAPVPPPTRQPVAAPIAVTTGTPVVPPTGTPVQEPVDPSLTDPVAPPPTNAPQATIKDPVVPPPTGAPQAAITDPVVPAPTDASEPSEPVVPAPTDAPQADPGVPQAPDPVVSPLTDAPVAPLVTEAPAPTPTSTDAPVVAFSDSSPRDVTEAPVLEQISAAHVATFWGTMFTVFICAIL